MTWNSDKIKTLRCRMGWTQAELARRLECDSSLIHDWEMIETGEVPALEMHIDVLILLEKQAEFASDQVFQSPLAEAILDESQCTQVDSDSVKRRFFENN